LMSYMGYFRQPSVKPLVLAGVIAPYGAHNRTAQVANG
jgi:hypothetical protein